ncbi:hypothetical protein EDD76_10190 [Kineothrix alysoides]|uniref:PlyCA N-terminal domain-containing protein n=1 Tax=Kineothrix alysoides TaxID=1469948 RepID=A0A4R1R623_9FIRM|nr:hypothetical protein [Kineothrix alysoides]TCL60993.1 hypothetical protein EDD76_10190 [Kineothrix alysoides]
MAFSGKSLKEATADVTSFLHGLTGGLLKESGEIVGEIRNIGADISGLWKEIREHGVLETGKAMLSGIGDSLRTAWEEDLINGTAKSRGELAGRLAGSILTVVSGLAIFKGINTAVKGIGTGSKTAGNALAGNSDPVNKGTKDEKELEKPSITVDQLYNMVIKTTGDMPRERNEWLEAEISKIIPGLSAKEKADFEREMKARGLRYPKSEGGSNAVEGMGNIPSDVLSLMNASIDSTWCISDSTAEAWFLSTNTVVIKKYDLNSTNIGEVTAAIKATGVSPVFFYAYVVNEGGGAGGFINHYGKNYYANNGGDTAVNAASGDAKYLASQSAKMNSSPAWIDAGNPVDFVPLSVKDSGNASFASMPSGSIGRAYIPATAAATWEVYYPEGLLKSYNKVQNYGAPMKGVLRFIVAMSKY